MQRISGALFRGEAQTRVLGSLGGGEGKQKTKMTKKQNNTTKRTTFKGNLENIFKGN